MALEVVPTVAGRLHSDQYTKIIIIQTPVNLGEVFCKIKRLRGLFAMFRSQSDSKIQI